MIPYLKISRIGNKMYVYFINLNDNWYLKILKVLKKIFVIKFYELEDKYNIDFVMFVSCRLFCGDSIKWEKFQFLDQKEIFYLSKLLIREIDHIHN